MAHGHEYEWEYQRQRRLQREVLEHIKRYSPKKWDTLHTHFAIYRGANIQPVLHDLKSAHYIEVSKDTDQIVRITASGLKRLEKQDYGAARPRARDSTHDQVASRSNTSQMASTRAPTRVLLAS